MPIDPEIRKTLDLRLAKGEISREEYKQLIETLQTADEIELTPIEPIPIKQEKENNDIKSGINRAHEVSVGVKAAVASTQSFVGSAFLAWILYYIGFYIIGLIVNICYLSSANRIKRETGVNPSGRGCLQLLLFVHFWIPLLIIVIIVIIGAHASFKIPDLLEGIENFFDNLF